MLLLDPYYRSIEGFEVNHFVEILRCLLCVHTLPLLLSSCADCLLLDLRYEIPVYSTDSMMLRMKIIVMMRCLEFKDHLDSTYRSEPPHS